MQNIFPMLVPFLNFRGHSLFWRQMFKNSAIDSPQGNFSLALYVPRSIFCVFIFICELWIFFFIWLVFFYYSGIENNNNWNDENKMLIIPKVRFKEALNSTETTGYTDFLLLFYSICNVIPMPVCVCICVLCELFLCSPSIVCSITEEKENICTFIACLIRQSLLLFAQCISFVWAFKWSHFSHFALNASHCIIRTHKISSNQSQYGIYLNSDIFKKILK